MAYEAEREALLLDFLLFDRRKVFKSGRKILNERGRDYFSLSGISVYFSLFLQCCCAVLCFLFRTYGIRRSGCFPEWSIELLAFANCLFIPNCLDRLLRPILVHECK